MLGPKYIPCWSAVAQEASSSVAWDNEININQLTTNLCSPSYIKLSQKGIIEKIGPMRDVICEATYQI